MAWSVEPVGGMLPGFTAAADFSAKQNYFCKYSAAGVVAIPSAATDLVLGVVCNAPASGYAVEIQYLGVAKVSASTAITAGTKVGTTNAGQAVTKSADTDLVAGIALTTAANAGDIISVLLTPGAQRSS